MPGTLAPLVCIACSTVQPGTSVGIDWRAGGRLQEGDGVCEGGDDTGTAWCFTYMEFDAGLFVELIIKMKIFW